MARLGVLAAALGAVLALSAGPAAAATLTVNTARDETTPGDGLCSLREATASVDSPGTANGDCPSAGFGANTIVLGPHTYALGTPSSAGIPLSVTGNVIGLTVTGAGEGRTTIDATALGNRILDIAPGAGVTIENLTMTGGHAPGGAQGTSPDGGPGDAGADGGAILNQGALTLSDMAITGSQAGTGGRGGPALSLHGGPGGQGGSGGAIFNAGALVLDGVTLADDHAGAGGEGPDGTNGTDGPAGAAGGAGGAGGAIASNGATVRVTGSTFRGDSAGNGGNGGRGGDSTTANGGAGGAGGAGGDGGAIWTSTGTVSVTNSTFASNSAGQGGNGGSGGLGGGPGGPGPTAGGNGGGAGDGGNGGALTAQGGSAGVSFVNTTLAGNAAGGAGAAGSPGVGNRTGMPGAPGSAGTGGGIQSNGATVMVQNSLLASNLGGNCSPPAPVAGIADAGHNLSFNGSGCRSGFAGGDPRLGPLQDNGGPSQTIALGAGSAAIDQVPAGGAGCPATDQRGVPRPSGPACDIGAYEVAPPVVNRVLAVQATGRRSVKIVVSVTANAGHGTMWVEYGRTKSYGRKSGVEAIAGVTPEAVSIVLRGLDPRRAYHYRVRVTTMDGTSRSADVGLAVPVLLSLQIRPSSFVLGHGAKVSYTDSRAGATTFTVQRRVRRRWVTVGTFTHRGRAGRNFVRFGRRFGKFGRGAYRLEATPRTVGAIGVTRRVRFTIIK